MTIAAVAGGATGGGIMAVDEISSAPDGAAIGGVPSEQRSVQRVGDLRERARETAAAREADRTTAAAGGTERRERPSGEPARSEPRPRRPLQVARSGEARAVAVAGRPRNTRDRRRTPRRVAAAPREAVPPAPAPAPAAPALPATEVGPEVEERGEKRRDEQRQTAGVDGGRRTKAERPRLPAIELPAAAGGRREGKHGGKHEGKRGGGHDDSERGPWPKPGKQSRRPAPAAPPAPGPEHKGRPGGGNPQAPGHGQGGPGNDDEDDRERVKYAAKQAEAALTKVLGAILPTR
jgi:hypothetical protein